MKRTILAFCLLLLPPLTFAQLIEKGSVWKHPANGSDQGTAWQHPAFNDSDWSDGSAQLGYDDNDKAIVLGYGENPSNKYMTYYFRKNFEVADPDEKLLLKAGLMRDDSAEVYINGSEVFRKEAYLLATGKNTDMLIAWQMDSTRTCHVDWGTDTTYAFGPATTTEYGEDHQHKILLRELNPETKYFYRVSCERVAVKTGSFITGSTNDNQRISFFVYGDTRSNPGTHNRVAEKIMQEVNSLPETQTFIISTGDLVADGNKEQDWQEQFFSSDFGYIRQMMSILPYVAAVGNHEGQGQLFKKYFPYPLYVSGRYYYSFDYGPAHFTVIDQFTSYDEGDPQYEWLVNDLASSEKLWKFILLHEPGWSAGGGHANNRKVQRVIQPLCEMYGVQFVLAGHNHYYARALVNGVNHITTGGGGAPLYTPHPDYDSIITVSKTNHFCRIDISGDTLFLTATDKDGHIIDSFSRPLNPAATPEYADDTYFDVYSAAGTIIIVNKKDLKGRLSVFDTYGRNIFTEKISAGKTHITVDIAGTYFVRIDYKKNRQTVKKVFVR